MNRIFGTTISWAGPSTAIIAFLAAACCVLPMVFVALGLGGAWLAVLDMPLVMQRLDRSGQRTLLILVMGSLVIAASFAVWEHQDWIRGMIMEARG
ncbi:MAG: hypothetical protein P1U65_06990 [Minwuia sp.]|nr:hypothetical protein [Minwuia sp.]